MKIKKKVNVWVKKIIAILMQRDMLVLPGQLAFFLLLATVPTISLIAYLGSFLHLSTYFFSNFVTNAFGADIAGIVIPAISEMTFTPAFLLPLLVAFYTASGGASSIIVTSNQLYHLENTSFIRRKIKGLIMTLVLMLLVIFLLFVPAFGDKVIEIIQFSKMNTQLLTALVTFINWTKGPISWVLIFFLIKVIYTMAPDGHVSSKYTTKGSLFTSINIIVVTELYSFYANNIAHYGFLYGSLARFIVLMIWFYFISYTIVIGIAINSEEYQLSKKEEQNK